MNDSYLTPLGWQATTLSRGQSRLFAENWLSAISYMLITKTYNQALKKRLRTNPEALKVNGDGVCAPRNQIVAVNGTVYRPILPIGSILSPIWHQLQVPTGPIASHAVLSIGANTPFAARHQGHLGTLSRVSDVSNNVQPMADTRTGGERIKRYTQFLVGSLSQSLYALWISLPKSTGCLFMGKGKSDVNR